MLLLTTSLSCRLQVVFHHAGMGRVPRGVQREEFEGGSEIDLERTNAAAVVVVVEVREYRERRA